MHSIVIREVSQRLPLLFDLILQTHLPIVPNNPVTLVPDLFQYFPLPFPLFQALLLTDPTISFHMTHVLIHILEVCVRDSFLHLQVVHEFSWVAVGIIGLG